VNKNSPEIDRMTVRKWTVSLELTSENVRLNYRRGFRRVLYIVLFGDWGAKGGRDK